MKKYDILILGNGFDLACGFKTSYDDFYKFLKYAVNNDREIFFANFNVFFPQIDFSDAKKFCIEFKNLLDGEYKDNIFVEYFLNYNSNLNGWVAFEKELLCIAKGYDAFFEALKKYDNENTRYCDFTWNIKNNSEALRVFSFLQSCKYYQIKDTFNDAKEIKLCFSIKGLANLTAVQWQIKTEQYIENFIDFLYDELNAFSQLFAIYLHIATIQPLGETKFNFTADKIINFNYTNTYDRNYPFDDVDVCYLNGNIITETDNIVFGFNSDENFKNSGLDILSKSSQRLDKQTDYVNLKKFLPDKDTSWFNESIKIGVYGHSLDKADKDTLNMIFTSHKDITIDIYYLDNKAKKSLISNIKNILSQQKFNLLSANSQINFIPCSNQNDDEEDDFF